MVHVEATCGGSFEYVCVFELFSEVLAGFLPAGALVECLCRLAGRWLASAGVPKSRCGSL